MKVLMIGPARSVNGGISAVVNNYYKVGLDKKIESGPISIYFKLEKELPLYQRAFKYEYSSTKGFKQMKCKNCSKQFLCNRKENFSY